MPLPDGFWRALSARAVEVLQSKVCCNFASSYTSEISSFFSTPESVPSDSCNSGRACVEK